MNATARALIARLGLEPLPREGGYFRATWRNATASAIYFLLTPDDFSALHRMPEDEVWHFHAGDGVEHVQLDAATGRARIARLGSDVLAGEEPQVVVRGGVWQGARLARPTGPHGWALMGCTVSPPWDDAHFELGDRAALRAAFPALATIVAELTR